MKKIYLLVASIIISFCSWSQTTLPYYTGFDNIAQRNGWLEFRKGYISTFDWGIISFNPYSAPNCLYHDYPVGSSGADTTIDWFVSPGFNFTSGGKIDSLKAKIYSISGSATPVDEISLYLLTGSNNPSLATSVILLAELKSLVSNKDIWRDTGNFIIPPATGISYIGIKYRATNNWFVINMDNFYFSSKPTGINNASSGNKMLLYPNPAGDKLIISFPGTQVRKADISFTNTLGQIVLIQQVDNVTDHQGFNISQLPAGNYFIRAITDTKMIFNQNLLIDK